MDPGPPPLSRSCEDRPSCFLIFIFISQCRWASADPSCFTFYGLENIHKYIGLWVCIFTSFNDIITKYSAFDCSANNHFHVSFGRWPILYLSPFISSQSHRVSGSFNILPLGWVILFEERKVALDSRRLVSKRVSYRTVNLLACRMKTYSPGYRDVRIAVNRDHTSGEE